MEKQDMKRLIESGVISVVWIVDRMERGEVDSDPGVGVWEVWAFGPRWPSSLSSRLKVARTSRNRQWAVLGRVYAFVMDMGWTGPVTVFRGSPWWCAMSEVAED